MGFITHHRKEGSMKLKIIALALTGFALVGLTGCSEYKADKEAVNSSSEYIELERKVFSADELTYFDGSSETAMVECGDKGIWDPYCYKTSDGSITFEYKISKNGVYDEELTIDGETKEAKCITPWSGPRRCWTAAETS